MKGSMTRTSHTTVPLDPNWKFALQCAALEVFEVMAGVQLQVDPAPEEEQRGEETAMVGMAGALCGMITLRCSRRISKELASQMLGEEGSASHSAARDALGELCNMIAGNFKGKVNQLADHCMLSVPTVISGEDYSLSTVEATDGVTIALRLENEPIWVSLIMHN
jgi:chemotaxis protein CheX